MPAKSPEAIKGANARKRIMRTKARLIEQRSMVKNRSQAKAFTKQIEELEKAQRKTYIPRKGLHTKKQIENFNEAIKVADKISQRSKSLKSPTQVRNFAFREQMRWASSENMKALSVLEHEEVKAFFRLTEDVWKDVSYAEREKSILKYFDTNSLQDAFEKALSKPGVREKIQAAIEKQALEDKGKENWTEEERAFYESLDKTGRGDNYGSPEWSMALIPFDPKKSWKDEVSGEVAK